MKKLTSVILAILMVLALFVFSACTEAPKTSGTAPASTETAQTAEETATKAEAAKFNVSIANEKGEVVVFLEELDLTDADEDGALTVNDGLLLVHEAKYPGGAAAGYATDNGQYGPYISKLWGVENGGSYGYYVNHKASNGLADPLNDGDVLYAFVYTDTTNFADKYTYFQPTVTNLSANTELELFLCYVDYDETWSPVSIGVPGAVITIDGEETEYTTDENGKVTLNLNEVGSHEISAYSANNTLTLVLVPPVAIVNVH